MSEETNLSSVPNEAAPAPAQPGGKRAAPMKNEKKNRTGLVIGIVAAVLVLAYTGLCAAAQTLYAHAAFPGTSVLGMDVSGLSAQEAEQRWTEQGSALLDGMTIRLTRDGQEIGSTTLSDLGVTVLPVYVSKAAGCDVQDRGWGGTVESFLRGGWRFAASLFAAEDVTPQLDVDPEKLTAACDHIADTVGCTLVDGSYRLAEGEGLYITKPADGEKLDAAALESALRQQLDSRDLSPVACTYTQRAAQPLDIQALHDEISGTMAAAICDKSTGKPTQSRVGVQFDVAAVQAQLDAAAPGAEFLADAQVQFPPAATEELEQAMFRDVIGTCTTTCAGPWGRRQNIKLASAAINGRIYNPGEEFWYNATVGQRTEARGFQPAAAYSGGKTVTSIGGGICQVSSTLYYATLMADLKIVLRYAHMFDPGYMPVTGCDATVSWGGPDFAFRNSTDYPIKITTSYNDETNQLTITLLGTKTDDHYVEMTNQFLSYSERKTVYQESESIAPGTTEVEQYGHNGYAVQTYRNVYAGDGTLLRSTKEAYSDYDRADKIILVAPGELPQ
jgi:hypothetical protein